MRRSPVLVIAAAAAALVLAGCGDEASAPALSTAADGTVVAELRTKAGDAWTVTLPEGATEAYDLYGNDGRDPIGIWQQGPIAATADELFAIGLPQQGGTGYAWRPVEDTAAGTVVELVQQGVNPHDPGEGVPGGEQTQYYVYRAKANGTGTIEFGLFAPGSDAPERTETFEIEVS